MNVKVQFHLTQSMTKAFLQISHTILLINNKQNGTLNANKSVCLISVLDLYIKQLLENLYGNKTDINFKIYQVQCHL